jgi:hypothetical protein
MNKILEVLYLMPCWSRCSQSGGKLFESYWQSILAIFVILSEPKFCAAAFRVSWKGYAEDIGRFQQSEIQ